ncbi:MAG: zeta toxin family protein [Alphaproteobacteria bacterium]
MIEKSFQELIDSQPKTASPEFLLVGGGSSVGKSAIVSLLKHVGTIRPQALVLGPELIKEYYPEFESRPGERHGHREKDPENIARYHRVLLDAIDYALTSGVSVVLDDHGEDLPFIRRVADRVGHSPVKTETAMIGVYLPPENYIARLKKVGVSDPSSKPFSFAMHAAKGYAKNFDRLVPLFDTTILYEIKGDKPIVTAEYITEAGKVKENGKDQKRFDEFQAIRQWGEQELEGTPDDDGVPGAAMEPARQGRDGNAASRNHLGNRIQTTPYSSIDWKAFRAKLKAEKASREPKR